MKQPVCPYCGGKYTQFRCSVATYEEAFHLLWTSSECPEDWRYKRRHTVLGVWGAVKRKEWLAHIALCRTNPDSPIHGDAWEE